MAYIKSRDIKAKQVSADKMVGGTAGQSLVAQGATSAPLWKTVSGDATLSSAGAVTVREEILRTATVTITNAEFLALRAAPKQLVAAPAAGKVHLLVSAVLSSLASGGAYTETADNLAVRYENGSGAIASGDIETTGVIDGTTQKYSMAGPVACLPLAAKALVLHNTGDGEFGGGDAANTMKVHVAYRTITLP